MSVINQVLNDIEKRNEIDEKQQTNPFEPVKIEEFNRFKYLYITIAVLFMILVLLSWWFFQINDHERSEDKVIESNITQLNTIEVSTIKETISSKVLTLDTPNINAIPDDITKEETIANVAPIILEKKQQKAKDVVKSVVQKSQKDSLETLTVIEDKEVEITAEPITKINQSLSITPIEMSDDEVAQLKLNQGIKEQQLGRIEKAQQHWQQALALNPELHDARLQLAASFYGANEISKTIDLLLKATYQFPAYDGYRLLASQVYYQQDQLEQALSILNSPFLTPNAATENIVLAGSLAQQLQQWEISLSNYQVLTQRDDSNSQWLLGVAIAYDALEQSEQAYNNYAQIITLSNVDNTIIEYAKQRMSVLKNLINSRGNNG